VVNSGVGQVGASLITAALSGLAGEIAIAFIAATVTLLIVWVIFTFFQAIFNFFAGLFGGGGSPAVATPTLPPINNSPGSLGDLIGKRNTGQPFNVGIREQQYYSVRQNSGKEFSKGGPPREPGTGNYLPDPAAQGPHTTLGQRSSENGDYTQGATFDKDKKFQGRTDVTDHGCHDHQNPHWHPENGPNKVKRGPHPLP